MSLIPIHWWNKEVHNFQISQQKFVKKPWANGVILLACVAVAMLLANLPFTKGFYHGFLHTELTVHVASPNGLIDWYFPRGMTMEKFINDILMVIFFFTVGLEIKREIVCGELSSFKKAILPVIAAFGGVLMPALIYTIVNHGTVAASGWGIPTATDIAFAVGILSILGDKVPVSLKVFLTALAIADDLIAILVVALFYGGHINLPLLAIALMVILFVALMK
jgi:NhaA family Na+:H+ antiporter